MAVAFEMQQYLEAFLVEADEELALIQTCLERLRHEGARLVIVEEAARATANLKSAAATMGFRTARDLAHATWDMLNAWRRGSVKKPAASLDLLAQAHRRLVELINGLKEGSCPEPSAGDLTIQLRALVSEDAENPWPEAERSAAVDPAEQRFIVRLSLEKPCQHPIGRFLVCQGYLLGLGRVLASDPPPDSDEQQNGLGLRFLLATPRNVLQVRHVVESIPHVDRVEVTPATPEIGVLPPEVKRPKKPTFHDWTLRVEARYLEDLSEITAELGQIRSGYRALEHEISGSSPGLSFRLSRLGDRLEYPLRRLSEIVSQLRQIQAEFILTRLARSAQERGKDGGKEIEVRMVGGDTILGVDQAEDLMPLLEQILAVLVEGSAQTPVERHEAGKPRQNKLDLTVRERDAKITLSLSFDGHGMDLERELRTGGRLAELRHRIESCGGTLDGQAWPGQGTLINIEFSPPGNYLDVLAIELGTDLFALPLALVVEARRTADESVVLIDGRTYLAQKRELIPLHDLAGLLGRPSEATGGFWLFIRTADSRLVLRVPTVLGARQVVVRPNASGVQLPGLCGACLDSVGRVYSLLSPEQLVKLAAGSGRTAKKAGLGAN